MLRSSPSCTRSQNGAALLIFTLVLVIGLLSAFLSTLNSAAFAARRDRVTNDALVQAKEALIGFSASIRLTPDGAKRPGDLPCPDADNDGISENSCGNVSGSTGQNLRLGRLPWKTLGLPDLRDGDGERLWYAISNNFKNVNRTSTLNSDTDGSITIKDLSGSVLHDGAGITGAVAVIISPGIALTRQDGTAQERSAPNTNDPVQYLDTGNGEDNAAFVDKSQADGFINGVVRNAANDIIVNDRLLAITPDSLMPILEKRVAAEVSYCLTEFAQKIENGVPINQGRYPWAAPLSSSSNPSYDDVSGIRFGRVPDTPFSATRATSGTSYPMDDSWTGNCNINSNSGWWLNWKEVVFYAVADAYKPVSLEASPVSQPACGATGTCITDVASVVTDKHLAIIVAGRRLPNVAGGQPRALPSDKGTISNYLEAENATPFDDRFSKQILSPFLNDYVLYQ